MELKSTCVLLCLCLLIAPVYDCRLTDVEQDNQLSSDHDVSHRHHAKDDDERREIFCDNSCGSQNTVRPTSAVVGPRIVVLVSSTVVRGPTAPNVGPRTCAYESAGQADLDTHDVHTSVPAPDIDTACAESDECISLHDSSQILGARCFDKLNESKPETPVGAKKYVQLLPMAEEDASSAQRVEGPAAGQDSLCDHTSCTTSPRQFTEGLLTHKQLHLRVNQTFSSVNSLVGLMLKTMLSNVSFGLTSINSWQQDLELLTSVKINPPFLGRRGLTTGFSREYSIPYKVAPSLWYTLGLDMVVLILLLLRLSKECIHKTNKAYLRFLVNSFFNDPAISKKDKSAKYYDSCKEVQEKSNWKPFPLDVLEDIIMQPWTLHIPSHASANVKTSIACQWSDDTLCDECQRQLDRHNSRTSSENDHVTECMSRRAGQWEVEVRPVRRFLPDTTNNPDLDLVHVGYRLATLSALPPAVPVSRVKLADAGFYYRGQGDEVTCYACRGRHSGWTNDDKPWDVHRRISPNCPHVLEAPGGHGGSTATTGVSVPPVTAPHQDPKPAAPRGTVHGPEQATSQDVASQSSQLVTSQGSTVASSLTSPRISEPNNNPHHAMNRINRHSEIHVEDGDLTNPTSLDTTTLIPAAARTEARTGAKETMPPVYARSQVFTTSVQSVATNSPLNVLRSGLGRTEATNASSGTARTDSSGDLSASGTGVGSVNVTATTSAESAIRTQVVTGDNTQGVGSGGSPSGRPSVAMVGTASVVPRGGANNTGGEEASARYMFPRAGLELGGAVYPMYQDMASRRRSFPRWDETHAPPLDQIILCGMFYAGYADCVRCFYCGVGLKHWEVTDDVWTEHVRWRPSCGYLKAVKGDDFIRSTQARLARETSGDDDNDDGPADGNDRPLGPPAPPRPQLPPGAAPQDIDSRGESRSGAGSSALTRTSGAGQQGNARSAPPSNATAAPPQPAATSGTLGQTTITTTTTVTASSTVPTPSSTSTTSATAAASPPESCNNQASTRPEGGTSISVVPGETQSQRVARLQAENAQLTRRLRCKVCHREPIDTIIMPCGHLVVCESCARNTTQCPLCHGRIRATAKVHMS